MGQAKAGGAWILVRDSCWGGGSGSEQRPHEPFGLWLIGRLPSRSDGLPPPLIHALLMRAGVEEMVEVVPVVALGALGRGAAVVGLAAEGAQPMMRGRCVCRYRQKSRSP